jgi:hypothetical protein
MLTLLWDNSSMYGPLNLTQEGKNSLPVPRPRSSICLGRSGSHARAASWPLLAETPSGQFYWGKYCACIQQEDTSIEAGTVLVFNKTVLLRQVLCLYLTGGQFYILRQVLCLYSATTVLLRQMLYWYSASGQFHRDKCCTQYLYSAVWQLYRGKCFTYIQQVDNT